MDSSSDTSVDVAVNQLISTIKSIHNNAVASLEKEVVRLKAEFRELRSEKSELVSEYDLLNDEQLTLAGNLKSELNKKGVLYQLLGAFTKTLSSSSSGTATIKDAMNACKTLQKASSSRAGVEHTLSQLQSASDANSESNRGRKEIQQSEKTELREKAKVLYPDVRTTVGRSSDASVSMECHQNHSQPSTIEPISRKLQPKQSSSEDPSASPLMHLLNLVSSTHQLTVHPLRMEARNLAQGIEQMKKERDDFKMKIKWVRSEVEHALKKLEVESSHNEQMKELFKMLSHGVASQVSPKTDDKDPVVVLKPTMAISEECADVQCMRKSARQIEETSPSPELLLTGDEDFIIELQGDATVECCDYTSEEAPLSLGRSATTFRTTQPGSGPSNTASVSSACSPRALLIPSEKTSILNRDKGTSLMPVGESSYYQCTKCAMTFPDYITLSKHKRCHRSVENICRFCKRPFSSSTALKIHMRRHTGERPYLCQECGKAFAQAISLRIHLRKHTGERPHKCFDCGREFHDPCYFKKHQRKHLENKFKK